MRKLFVFTLGLMTSTLANAEDLSVGLKPGMHYQEARAWLIAQGWQPLVNQHIDRSSLYATEVYAQGMPEVVDCISMEIDGCSFRFVRKRHGLEVKTITRQLQLERFSTYKIRP